MIIDLIIITLVTAVSAFICLPFFRSGNNTEFYSFDGISTLEKLNEKKNIYISEIKDIEFDYGLGKLSEEDYNELLENYKTKAAEIMEITESEGSDSESGDMDSIIEKQVLKYRKLKSGSL